MKAVSAVVVAALTFCAHPAQSQQTTALDDSVVDRIEALIGTEMSGQGIPGLSVAVGIDNTIVYSNGFGMADVENSVPTRAVTRFRTASIAKPITAVLVLQQVEAGHIDLDAPVQQYCERFTEKRWPVSTRQLLGHLGGVRHYKSREEASSKQHFFSLKAALEQFADDPLLHEPGTRFSYSSFGFNLLGSIVEGATERDFMELLQEAVLEPAGMQHTRSDDHFAVVPNRARGYMRPSSLAIAFMPGSRLKPGELYNARLHDTSMKIPGGGLLSTSADLVRFAMAAAGGKLLKPETVSTMWSRQKTADDKETDYGLGWGIREHQGVRHVAHGGGQAGTSTYLMLIPDSGVCVAVMSNLQGARLTELAQSIAAAATPVPAEEDTDSEDATDACQAAGRTAFVGTVVDAATDEPVPARVYVQDADGRWLFVGSAAEGGSALAYREQWVPMANSVELHTTVSAHPFRADLEPGTYTFTIERGKEYAPLVEVVEIDEEPVEHTFALRRWVNMADLGWYSGETHVHRRVEELPNVMLAEDLNVAFPVTFWTINAGTSPGLDPSPLRRQGPSPVRTAHRPWPGTNHGGFDPRDVPAQYGVRDFFDWGEASCARRGLPVESPHGFRGRNAARSANCRTRPCRGGAAGPRQAQLAMVDDARADRRRRPL